MTKKMNFNKCIFFTRFTCKEFLEMQTCIRHINSVNSSCFLFCKLLNKISRTVTLPCEKLSSSCNNYQLNKTTNKNISNEADNVDVIDNYMEVPIEVRSVKQAGKDIGLKLNVRTVHKSNGHRSQPVVLALHGMPGDASDFEKLSYELANHGIKFITPDFPGCGKSKVLPDHVFNIDYSPVGKADMLNRILDKLEIDKVDVLVSHSAGSYLGFRAAAELDRIKSAVFLNFLGGKPHRYAQPFKLLQLNAKLMKVPGLQSLYISLLPRIYLAIGFSKYDAQPLQVAIQNVATAEYEKILEHAETIKQKKKPVIFAWATTDKIVEIDIPYKIIRHVGIKDSHILKLCRENRTKEMEDQLTEMEKNDHLKDWYFRAIQFDRGGHLLQKNQVPELTKHIIDLIKHLQK